MAKTACGRAAAEAAVVVVVAVTPVAMVFAVVPGKSAVEASVVTPMTAVTANIVVRAKNVVQI